MVYIAPDGTVHANKPWGLGRITDMFWGMLNFVVAFFRTLVPIGNGGNSGSPGASRRSGGGGGGGPGGPGGGPKRRMGGITTIQDCNIPGGG